MRSDHLPFFLSCTYMKLHWGILHVVCSVTDEWSHHSRSLSSKTLYSVLLIMFHLICTGPTIKDFKIKELKERSRSKSTIMDWNRLISLILLFIEGRSNKTEHWASVVVEFDSCSGICEIASPVTFSIFQSMALFFGTPLTWLWAESLQIMFPGLCIQRRHTLFCRIHFQVLDLSLTFISGLTGMKLGQPVPFNLSAQGKLIGPLLHETQQGAYYILFGLGNRINQQHKGFKHLSKEDSAVLYNTYKSFHQVCVFSIR